MGFGLVERKTAATFCLEDTAPEGVWRIAEKVACDVEKVSGKKPSVTRPENDAEGKKIYVLTVGCSPLAEELFDKGILKEGNLKAEREVFSYQWIEDPFAKEQTAMVIVGSDKRGTIYGLFELSERIGISPMCYFGDAAVVKKQELVLEEKAFFSKQPSVEYRGFFINDEWPAFGNWCTEHFGDVNADAYEKIFELLLRMKGNYLWPAMWNSSFSEDGPGLENARLADLYGVVMGTSHHEPLCRAGVEWQRQYRDYGTDSTWDFIGNGEAISRFWEKGIERNHSFENVITIGMRGESDSKLLSEDATMADNIAVLEKAITRQQEILKSYFGQCLKDVPRMLAIYKEVEGYYYGDETCRGLKDWEELRDVIFLLSDDNHGNLRALPTKDERSHPGGFGMYYHLDYHGGPISYEWVNSTGIAKVWDQMCTAYEYGVRRMWIVNVGDLKGVEYPLNFFMDLAYDFEKNGTGHPEIIGEYPKKWLAGILGEDISPSLLEKAEEVLKGYVQYNAVRRPEYTRPEIYHPTHFLEGQRMVERAEALIAEAQEVWQELEGDKRIAFESTVYYPALASLHLHCMNILAGYNHLLSERGSVAANEVALKAKEHLRAMEQAVKDFHEMNQKKWNHMMDSAHTGFRSWDDYNWTYPVFHSVEPIPCPKAIVSFRHEDQYDLGVHWQNRGIRVCDALSSGAMNEIWIDIDSRGNVDFDYEIVCEDESLAFSKKSGHVDACGAGRDSVLVRNAAPGISPVLYKSDIPMEEIRVLTVKIHFANGTHTESKLGFTPMGVCTFPYIVMDAAHYYEKSDTSEGGFFVIPERGRFRDAIKCAPLDKDFSRKESKPCVTYKFRCVMEGEYRLTFELVPANPDHFGGRFAFDYSVNDATPRTCYGVEPTYCTEYADREWDYGVTNHTRKQTVSVSLKEGDNTVTIYAGEPGFMLERMILVPEKETLPSTYLGPRERLF